MSNLRYYIFFILICIISEELLYLGSSLELAALIGGCLEGCLVFAKCKSDEQLKNNNENEVNIDTDGESSNKLA